MYDTSQCPGPGMKSNTLHLLTAIVFALRHGQSQGTFDCHCAAAEKECFAFPTPCLSGCQSGWDGPFCQRQNVAFNRSSSQSGVYVDTSDCVPDTSDVQRFCGAHGAQLAVDGSDDTDYWHGSCAVTDTSNQSAWWELDLGATYNISNLQIYQANHVPLPPRYIEVFVDGQECYNVTGSDISSTIIHVTCHQTLSGSTLTLRTSSVDTAPSLTLCEVKIFQCSDFWFGSQCQYRCHCKDELEVCDKNSGACASQCAEAWSGAGCQDHNIALNQSAHQEGTWSDAGNCTTTFMTYCGPRPASLAVDGSTDQNFQHGSCSQTALGRPVTSWDLSLGSLHQIYRMKIYFPQKDIYSTAGLQVTVDGAVCYVSNTSLPTIADITCRQPLSGVFVSINLPPFPTSPGVTSSPGDRVLALCEVLIYECDDFWFGGNCSQLCRCQNTSDVCDKMTGECPRTACSAGWMGTGCQTVCPSSTFGLNCSSNCGKCADNATCDHVTGACPGSCAAGFAGKDCSECLTGMYGVNCDQSCPGCPGNGSCNRNNGTCSTPCPAHYTGANCDRCHDDWYGSSCQLPCGECRNDGPCNTTTGLCPNGCDPGWQGALCQQECPDGRYGMDCSKMCGHCMDPAPCDKLTGFCLDECVLGWSGDLCNKCDDFWFGGNCSQLCRCQNTSEVCDKMTGECPRTACSAGWMGTGCQTVCPSSMFGLNCSSNCGKCADNATCDHVTGACPGSCAAGFAGKDCSECLTGMYGVNCDQSCPGCPGNGSCNRNNGTCSTLCPAHYTGANCDRCHDDWYGSSCQLPCGECRNDGPCNTTTGLCPDGCDPGWQGALCNQECPDGRYGMDCSKMCGHCMDPAPCDKLTGFCLDECVLGWSGDLCNKQQPTTRPHQQPTPPSSTTVTSTHTAATTKTPIATLSTSSPATTRHTTKARQHDKTSQGHPPTSHRPTQHTTDQRPTQGPTSQGHTGHGRTGKSDHHSTNQLSEGAVAAIVVSCVLALCIVLHSFIFIRYSRRRPCHWLQGRRKQTYGRDRIESPEDFDFTSGTELPKYGPALFPDTEGESGTVGICNPNYIPDTVSPDV